MANAETSRRTIPVQTHFAPNQGNGYWTVQVDGKFFRTEGGTGRKERFHNEQIAVFAATEVWLESPNW